ncbi:MAG: DUF1398 domain-containing protein [Steroidobacteraceae bacterium]
MNEVSKAIAQQCMDAVYGGTMNFPQTVKTLMENGFEGYHVDYLRGTTTYYLPDGDNIELTTPPHDDHVAEAFDVAVIKNAIKEAQQQVEGFTYKGFCKKVRAAGCAGYIVSFPGKRVLYFGRTAETHVENFPK